MEGLRGDYLEFGASSLICTYAQSRRADLKTRRSIVTIDSVNEAFRGAKLILVIGDERRWSYQDASIDTGGPKRNDLRSRCVTPHLSTKHAQYGRADPKAI